jgi:hypothetical protein
MELLVDCSDEDPVPLATTPQVLNLPAVRAWDPAAASMWFASQGLGGMAAVILSQEIVGSDILDLNHDDLRSLGFQRFSERKAILRVVCSLRRLIETPCDMEC